MRQPNSLKQITKKPRLSKGLHPLAKNNQLTFDTFRTLGPKILMNPNLNFHQNELHQVQELFIKISCLPLALRISLQKKENDKDYRNFNDQVINVFLTNRGAKITVKKINNLQQFNLFQFNWLKIIFKQSISKVQILKKDNENFNLKNHIFKSIEELSHNLSKDTQKTQQNQTKKQLFEKSIFSFIFPQIQCLESQEKQFKITRNLNEKTLSHQKLKHKFKSTQLRKDSQIKHLPKISIKQLQKLVQPNIIPRVRITPDNQKHLSIHRSKNDKKPDTRDNTTMHTDSSYVLLEQSKTLKLHQTHKNMYVNKRMLKNMKEIPSNNSIISINYEKNKNNQLRSFLIQNQEKNINTPFSQCLSGKTQNFVSRFKPLKRQNQDKVNFSINILDMSQSQIQRRKSKFDTQKLLTSKLLPKKNVQNSQRFQNKQKINYINKEQTLKDYLFQGDVQNENEIQQQIQKQKSLASSISNQWSQNQKNSTEYKKSVKKSAQESSIYESQEVSSRQKTSQKKPQCFEEDSLYQSLQI